MVDPRPEDITTRLRSHVRYEYMPAAARVAMEQAAEVIDSLLADRARMEKALRNLTRAFDSLQVERWDDETKVEIHLPRTKRVRPVSWVYVSDVKEARQAIGASQ